MIQMRKSTVSSGMTVQPPTGLASTRFGRPRLPRIVLGRPRLEEAMDTGVRQAVTLICAGPGWGKTIAAASWAAARSTSGPIAWLALDDRHNEPSAFWSDVVMALTTAGVALPGDPLASAPGFSETFAQQVAEMLEVQAAPVVLVLDDLQEVYDDRVLAGLAALLHVLPERLRLVLVTRTEPTLPLHRFRAAGGLTEIRTRQLAFPAAEAAELLSRHGHRLPEDDLAVLLERTQGWAVGLLMASDAGTVDRDPPAVADYLIHEVLAGQPAHIRRSLLCTSIPDRVCGELADELTATTDGLRVLERLERANVFITRLEQDRRWFEYHPMWRDVLRHQLELENPAAVPGLHLLTARWYAREGATLDALAHAAAARDWPFVGRLLVQYGLALVVSADRLALVEVMRRIPPEEIARNVDLMVASAVLVFFTGELHTLPEHTARVRAMLTESTPADQMAIDVPLRILDALALRIRGDSPGLIAATSEILGLLAVVHPAQLPSLPQYRAIALNNKGVGLFWAGHLDDANRYLWAASTAARDARVELVETNALAHLALLTFLQGSIRESEAHVAAVHDLTRRHDLEPTPQSVAAYLALALIELERDRVTEAKVALSRAEHAQGEQPESTLAVVSSVIRIQLLLARAEPVAAGAVLREARRDLDAALEAPLLDRWLSLTESHIELAVGAPLTVIARYRRLDPTLALTPAEQVTLARAHLMVGNVDKAEKLLAHAREAADSVSAVTAWLFTALAADDHGQPSRSVDALTHAVRRARDDGIRRPFRSFDGRLTSALDGRQRWLHDEAGLPFADVFVRVDGKPQPSSGPLTPSGLSEREMDVLRYLPTVLSAGEIAHELTISVNTVKAHVRSIYRKLGVKRRLEAVVEGRQRGLL